ncbi:MAG: hypothetical protein LBQ61_00120 [Spirochaetales bacterium]|jgi:tetratricopeptide (TPR) repeat protein|nr:hypothetical protein [Spirochaetales bacterium]
MAAFPSVSKSNKSPLFCQRDRSKSGPLVKAVFLILSLLLCPALSAQENSVFAEAEEAFLNNQPEKTAALLGPLVDGGSTRREVYLYQGIALQQLGRYTEAAAVFSRGVERTLPPHDKLYFNLGNNYFLLNQNADAERAYGRAIQENLSFAPAYLNRANTRMRMEQYPQAMDDYRAYLLRAPNSPQKQNIEDIIGRIDDYLKAEEARRVAEEERKAAEEARQRALMEGVLQSFQNLTNDTSNLQAESEGIQEVESFFDIVD